MAGPRYDWPSQPTRLIGRDQDVATAMDLLARDDVRLLTITGPAGVGKSRLAVAVAASVGPAFEHSSWFVDLAPVDGPGLVATAISQALGLRQARSMPLADSLLRYLVKRQTLLILDNFEHVLGAAPLVTDLLVACPRLKIIVTSRAPLHLRWEHEVPLSPLELPRSPWAADPCRLAEVPAIALFVDRAQAVEPSFKVDANNARAVADLCVHLDGLPLAIELAAARVRLLSPRAMLTRLTGHARSPSTRLDLLGPGALDMPPRHRTLRAAIGWSYDLLSPTQQRLFRRLAVFVGGCTLDAVDEICGDAVPAHATETTGAILDDLGALVENHLLRRDVASEGEPCFGMLATIREYAIERLEASGEADSVRRRHALAFMALAERAATELDSARETEWLKLLDREHDNLRAALAYLVASGDVEPGLRASRALGRFWSVRGHLTEGRGWLDALLDRHDATPSLARCVVLSSAGWLALEQGDVTVARSLCEEGLALARALGDATLVAEHLSQLGHVARQQSDFAVAQERYDESLALRREQRDQLGMAWSLRNLGHLARLRGEFETASACYEESLAVGGAEAPRSEVAGTLGYLGNALLRAGEVQRAGDRLARSVQLCREVGDQRRLAYALEGLAGVAAARSEWEVSLRLAGSATALRERISAPLWPAGHAALEHRLAPSRQRLGAVRAAECWAAGRALPLETVITEALEEHQPVLGARRAGTAPGLVRHTMTTVAQPLTHREHEVAGLIARGLTNRQIADQLVISEGTAAVHVKHILNKLDLRSRAQVAAWMVRYGLATGAN